MLNVTDLRVRYARSILVLHGVNVDIPESGVLAILGGNGAGKSTLLRAMSGTLRLHRGEVRTGSIELDGERIDRLDPAEIVRRGVVGVPEGRQIFGRMTVEENLRAGGITVASAARRASARDRIHQLFPLLADRAKQRAGLLSGGEQQMLAIGRALMSGPRLLLLDEPSLGLAPKFVAKIGEVITEIHAQGTSVVLVEQNARMALRIANQAVVLETGRVALSGTADELADNDRVRGLYLGGTGAQPESAPPRRPALARWGQ